MSDGLSAPGSSVDTHRFMANGASVRLRISPTASIMRAGGMPCAPKEPSPPALDTAATRRGDESPPPNGPCTIGYCMPRRRETLVSCHIRASSRRARLPNQTKGPPSMSEAYGPDLAEIMAEALTYLDIPRL